MKSEQGKVTVTIGSGEAAKDFTKVYTKTSVENVKDMLELLQDEKTATDVIKEYNYGHDLKIRAGVRNEILSENAGPEKSLDKMAKELVKVYSSMGKTLTIERALEMVKALQNEPESVTT